MNSRSDKNVPLINKKILIGCLIMIIIGVVLIVASQQPRVIPLTNKITENPQSVNDTLNLITIIEGKQNIITASKNDLLFNLTITYDENNNPQYVNIEKKSDLSNFYKQVGFTNSSKDVVFVYPIF